MHLLGFSSKFFDFAFIDFFYRFTLFCFVTFNQVTKTLKEYVISLFHFVRFLLVVVIYFFTFFNILDGSVSFGLHFPLIFKIYKKLILKYYRTYRKFYFNNLYWIILQMYKFLILEKNIFINLIFLKN